MLTDLSFSLIFLLQSFYLSTLQPSFQTLIPNSLPQSSISTLCLRSMISTTCILKCYMTYLRKSWSNRKYLILIIRTMPATLYSSRPSLSSFLSVMMHPNLLGTRVRTSLSHYILSYLITSYHHILSHHILSNHILSHHILSHNILSHHIISYRI